MQVRIVTENGTYTGSFIKKNEIFVFVKDSETKKVLCILKSTVKAYLEKKRDGSYLESELK